jgi:hypothetical protein
MSSPEEFGAAASWSPFRNSAYGFLFLLILAGFAFWPLYLSRLGGGIDAYTHFHAVVALSWCLLLVVQPFLVRKHRRLHRRIGALSYGLAPLFVLASLLLAHARFRAMQEPRFLAEAPALFLPLSACAQFAICYALALHHRRTPALHARFMIATGLPMVDPVLGRVLYFYAPALPHPLLYQAITFGITDLVLAAMLLLPFPAQRMRLRYALPAALFPLMHLAWFTVVQRPAWQPIAAWFRDLPLP